MLFYSLQEQQSFSENTMPSGLYRLFSLALEKFQIFASMRAVSHLWNNGCEKKQKIKAPWHSFRWFFLRVSGVPEQAKHVERRGEGEVGSETGSGFRGAIGAVSSGVRVAIGRWFHIQATSSSSSSLLSFGPPRRCSTRTTKSSSGSSANGGPNFPERWAPTWSNLVGFFENFGLRWQSCSLCRSLAFVFLGLLADGSNDDVRRRATHPRGAYGQVGQRSISQLLVSWSNFSFPCSTIPLRKTENACHFYA